MRQTIRVFSNFKLSDFEESFINRGLASQFTDARVMFNKSGRANFAIVLNCTRTPHFAFGKNLKTLKLLMEPEVRASPVHIFTWRHSSTFDRVLCHNTKPNDGKTVSCPPLVPPHAVKSYSLEVPPNKNLLVSAIGSSLTDLPMHAKRSAFLDDLERNCENVNVFGKGRTYLEDKSDGLIPYMYSIAIENSISKNYWTEKISDCFLSWTVPIYAGHESTARLFPEGAVIPLDPDSLESSWLEVQSKLSKDDYQRRWEAVNEARKIVLERYDLGKRCGEELKTLAHSKSDKSRLAVFWTFGDLVGLIARSVARVMSFCLSPFRRARVK